MKANSFIFKKFESVAIFLFIAAFCAVPISTTAGEICIYGSLLFALFSGNWSQKYALIKSTPLIYVIWGFCVLIFLGCFYSYSPLYITIHTAKSYLWLFILPFFLVLLPFEKLEKYALNTFLITIFIAMLLSYAKYFHLFQSAGQYFGLFHVKQFGGVSVFKDHIVQSMLFSLAFLVVVNRAIDGKSVRSNYLIYSLLLLINIMFMSIGRTGYLMLPLFLFFLVGYKFSMKKMVYPIVAICVLFCVGYWFSGSFHSRVSAGFRNIVAYHNDAKGSADTSMGIRLNEWKKGLYMFERKPIMGYGTGGASYALLQYDKLHGLPALPIMSYGPRTDSTYLNMLYQYGVFGVLYLIFFMCFIWKSSASLKDDYKLIIRAVIFSYAVLFIFNCWLSEVTASEMLMLFMTLCFSRPVQTGVLTRVNRGLSSNSQGDTCFDS